MDPTHETAYDMNEKDGKVITISEDLKRQIYENSNNIKHLQHQVSNFEEFRSSINSLKTDMQIIVKGNHSDLASMKSYFNLKLNEVTTTVDLKIDQLKKNISKNNKLVIWVIVLCVSLVLGIPTTLLVGLNIDDSRRTGYEKNADARYQLLAEQIKALKKIVAVEKTTPKQPTSK